MMPGRYPRMRAVVREGEVNVTISRIEYGMTPAEALTLYGSLHTALRALGVIDQDGKLIQKSEDCSSGGASPSGI